MGSGKEPSGNLLGGNPPHQPFDFDVAQPEIPGDQIAFQIRAVLISLRIPTTAAVQGEMVSYLGDLYSLFLTRQRILEKRKLIDLVRTTTEQTAG